MKSPVNACSTAMREYYVKPLAIKIFYSDEGGIIFEMILAFNL
jgi:hypothetical protein